MCKKFFQSLLALVLGFGAVVPTLAQKEKKVIGFVEKERSEFRKLIIENPNYFGTFPELKTKPILLMKLNTKYEEANCLGFYPDNDLLEAIVDVKLPYGYKGSLCPPSTGSFEYVRFFADWNGNGQFNDADEDLGIASVNVHDIPNSSAACLDKAKPLSYSLLLKVDSKKYFCTKPNLVKAKAILSWENPPTAGNPDFVPIWGNIIEKWIQIKPRLVFVKDLAKFEFFKELELDPEMLDLETPISKLKALAPLELKEIYKDKDVPELRLNLSAIYQVAEKIRREPSLMAKYQLNPKFSKMIENITAVLAEKPNSKYEELCCLGLNYDMENLVAILTVKLPYGYCGSLCTKGSNEYVGFWVNIWDQIEQMCCWKYLGTSLVNVHDIASIPAEGLQYAVSLPVDFSSYRDVCSNPKVLKVRAILSWQTPPTPNDPNYNPVWGNKVDALIQLKPGEAVKPGEQKPSLWSIGGMAIESISGNTFTVVSSTLGDGFANGPSVGYGYSALESPFGGTIAISGSISNPPNNPTEAEKLRYKVQYRNYGTSVWHDITNGFKLWLRIDGVPSGLIDQTTDSEGYFKYQKDLKTPTIVEAQDDILAIWSTPVADGDGLYEVKILLRQGDPGNGYYDVPSAVVKVMIDNTIPKPVEITLDAGPCERFTPGSKVSGKFKAVDQHFWRYGFSVSPDASPVSHTPFETIYPLLPAPGVLNGTFELDTSGMKPCGYVIYLHVWDRAIVNNHVQGNQNSTSVGFCLLKKE